MTVKKTNPPKKESREKGPISAAKLAAITKATEASIAALGGISPRTAGIARTKSALLWVYRWGWTTTSLLGIAVGAGVAARMMTAGLLVKTPTVSGGIDGSPSHFLTLSRLGLERATQISEQELPYKINAARIPQATINHHEIVQRLTAVRAKTRSDFVSFLTEREIRANANLTATDKIPDAVWLIAEAGNEYAYAIEVELSPKWKQELDTFVYQSLEQLREKYSGIEIFSHSKALLARYKKAFEPGTTLQTWTRKKFGWEKAGTVKIGPREDGVVSFRLITPEMLGKFPAKASAAATKSAAERPLDDDSELSAEDLMLDEMQTLSGEAGYELPTHTIPGIRL